MAVGDRVKRYRQSGGAADLVRVEVLVPAAKRGEILSAAVAMRDEHRHRKERLQHLIDEALALYGLRIRDNIDLDRLPDIAAKCRVVANALIERGDARAFALGRRMLDELEDTDFQKQTEVKNGKGPLYKRSATR